MPSSTPSHPATRHPSRVKQFFRKVFQRKPKESQRYPLLIRTMTKFVGPKKSLPATPESILRARKRLSSLERKRRFATIYAEILQRKMAAKKFQRAFRARPKPKAPSPPRVPSPPRAPSPPKRPTSAEVSAFRKMAARKIQRAFRARPQPRVPSPPKPSPREVSAARKIQRAFRARPQPRVPSPPKPSPREVSAARKIQLALRRRAFEKRVAARKKKKESAARKIQLALRRRAFRKEIARRVSATRKKGPRNAHVKAWRKRRSPPPKRSWWNPVTKTIVALGVSAVPLYKGLGASGVAPPGPMYGLHKPPEPYGPPPAPAPIPRAKGPPPGPAPWIVPPPSEARNAAFEEALKRKKAANNAATKESKFQQSFKKFMETV